jgi:hypothetical protein
MKHNRRFFITIAGALFPQNGNDVDNKNRRTTLKSVLMLTVLTLGFAAIAVATPCSITPPTNNLIDGAPSTLTNPASDTNEPCTVLPLTFDNFSYDLNTGMFTTPVPTVSTLVASFSAGVVTFGFNPNLALGSDMDLEFRVTGGVAGVSLSFNGTGSGFVNEVVCAVFTPTGICSPANTLAVLNVNSAGTTASASFAAQDTVWIFKDINTGNAPFSDVIQTFQTGVGVNPLGGTPEPATMGLLGMSLLVLGAMRVRSKSRPRSSE